LDPTREQVWDEFWGQRPSVADIYPAVSDITAEVLRMFPEPRGLRFLEVGAGTGREGHAFAERGALVTLLDISWEALRLSRGVSSLPRFVRGDALAAPFADGTFDLVYHQGLLEHFRSPAPLLRENYRLLKPGGFLLVDVPQRYHFYTLMKHALMAAGQWFAGWETEFSPSELERLVQAAGFTIERRYGYAMHPGLTYRLFREAGKKCGVKLPMYPNLGPLYRGWHSLVRRVEQRRAGHYFTVSVGVIARRAVG
jgi:SAM-dependent methyltransferase